MVDYLFFVQSKRIVVHSTINIRSLLQNRSKESDQNIGDIHSYMYHRWVLSKFDITDTAMPLLSERLAEFSIEFCEDVGVGVIWEELLTTSKLHLLKDQRDLLTEGPEVYWEEHCVPRCRSL